MRTGFYAMAATLLSFFVGMIVAPILLRILKKKKAGQTILSYVEQHNQKQGIPTMGGFIFLLSTTVASFAFRFESKLVIMMVLLFLFYGLIGFLDDFIKIHYHRNLGLKAYQKIISQVAVAVVAAYYCAVSSEIGTKIYVPIARIYWDLGFWGYLPFAVVTFLALSNAVNLTDGLDGLAGSVSAVYFATYTVIILVGLWEFTQNGNSVSAAEWQGMSVFCGALIGGLMAFLWFNSSKAVIFMGDTGSMALGGAAATVALFTKNPLISILVGIMFVCSCISVIVQVSVFKLRAGKRIFLMAPLHHHLELKGYSESKIVAFYTVITAIGGLVSLLII